MDKFSKRSTFRKLIKLIDGNIGRNLRKANNQYKYSKDYIGRDNVITMLFLQVSGCDGLRDIDTKSAIEISAIFSYGTKLTSKINIVHAKVRERSCIDEYVNLEENIYVFDKRYFKYSWYDEMTDNKVKFITC
ncbi:DUF4372 domain-containing protein [Clostridium gasigenes]|uniref:DUF4372 domain-containing protein n=1 Tax=Clostridium gasigenes TaxID=94869 RepID=UPI001C0DC38C|nr:DUF4372 domain-containing protein [Clostridium gasigenes]MBU3107481.1 DUF4372 domain-containing protein [Clostridium gasigenes]